MSARTSVAGFLTRPPIPTLFITATDTGVGKTVVTGAIAMALRARGLRAAVSKPVATGCVRRREGLVSEDAEFLAHCSESRQALDVICPQRYAEPLAPAVAAQRVGVALDWSMVDSSLRQMCAGSDFLLVEGVGGVLVPLDESRTVLDLAVALNSPTVVVARPGLGTINHTLLTVEALRGRGVPIAGVVVNRYPSDGAGVAEETNPRAIERWGKVKVLAIVPDEAFVAPHVPPSILEALSAVDWVSVAGAG